MALLFFSAGGWGTTLPLASRGGTYSFSLKPSPITSLYVVGLTLLALEPVSSWA